VEKTKLLHVFDKASKLFDWIGVRLLLPFNTEGRLEAQKAVENCDNIGIEPEGHCDVLLRMNS